MTPETYQSSVFNKGVSLAIWDRAGAETYGAVTKAFWKKTCGVMIVFDVTSTASFEYIEAVCLPELRAQDDAAAGCPVILVGNKSDGARVISVQEAQALAQRLAHALADGEELIGGVPYLETCCTHAEAGRSKLEVQAAFEMLAKSAYVSAFPDDTETVAQYEAEMTVAKEKEGGKEEPDNDFAAFMSTQLNVAGDSEIDATLAALLDGTYDEEADGIDSGGAAGETSSITEMVVECPAGCNAGDVIVIEAPDGREVEVEVPAGVKSGQDFEVEL